MTSIPSLYNLALGFKGRGMHSIITVGPPSVSHISPPTKSIPLETLCPTQKSSSSPNKWAFASNTSLVLFTISLSDNPGSICIYLSEL